MKKTKIRLGIAGLGHRAVYLAKLYKAHENYEIVALCDKYPARLEAAAGDIKVDEARLYVSFDKMIRESSPDAVFIAVNPDEQTDLACYAMEKGIHTACEVPAAYTINQCYDLVNAVRKSGSKYQLCEQTRYWGFIQQWREMAEKGEFGKVLFMEGEYLHYEAGWDFWVDPVTGEVFKGPLPPKDRKVIPTWRNRTFRHPIFYLPHELSPLLSITGDRVTSVSCMGTRSQSYHFEGFEARDLEVALMHTQNDTIMRLAAGFTSPHPPRAKISAHWYHVKGTKASVEWSRGLNDKPKLWHAGDNNWTDMDWTPEIKDSEDFIKNSGHSGADWWPIDNFASAIINDTDTKMNVYKAVESAAPAILAAESSEEGGVLKLVPDFREG